MAKRPDPPQHLDELLEEWPYEFGEVVARMVEGADGREVLQLRIDLGVLQLEVVNRPDGVEPEGHATYLDFLLEKREEEGDQFELDQTRCLEIDREFVQFYHRRIAWLSLREFERAARDADHTLALMDLSSAHAPDEDWADLHEQYRPFVLFHRTQAAAFAEIDRLEPQAAVDAIHEGLDRLREVFAEHDLLDEFDDDELVIKLKELEDAFANRYELEPPLKQQLAEAIAREQYELAAQLRDQIAKQPRLGR